MILPKVRRSGKAISTQANGVLTAKLEEDNLGLPVEIGGNGHSGAIRRRVSILLDLVRRTMDGRRFGKI
jgi:hypothetical protein